MSSPPPEPGVPWRRYIAALKRYKWVMALIIIVGTAAGVAFSRLQEPAYVAEGTLWINQESPGAANQGPIRPGQMLSATNWTELLRSYSMLERVAKRQRYFIKNAPADSAALASLEAGPNLRSAEYVLTTDAAGVTWTLSTPEGAELEQGVVGDSIGRSQGFLWAPAATELGRLRTISFSTTPPREIAGWLRSRITVQIPDRSIFMKIFMTGGHPEETARTLNVVLDEFIVAARELKRRNMSELSVILDEQLRFAEGELRGAESQLESFRVSAITQPSEGGAAPGLLGRGDPVMEGYFTQRMMQDNVRRDREALQGILAEARAGQIQPQALYTIPGLFQTAPGLRTALTELEEKQAQLRAATQLYTAEHPTVRELQRNVETMRTEAIPGAANEALATLRRQEAELDRRVSSATRDLQAIPARTIREMQLRRQVAVAENLYTNLQSRYEAARLAEASVVADITVLDAASPPRIPLANTASMIVLMAFGVSTAVAGGLALLLDRTDRRFRYADQASRDLGLEVIGAIPVIGGGDENPERATQAVEAFRSLRLTVRNAYPEQQPVVLTISSPGPADGKSMITANLALSFAEAGHRTVVVDGDTRRGQLHKMFDLDRRPGLLDYLMGGAALSEVIRETAAHPNLSVVPCGTRRHRGPELLTSPQMPKLIADLRRQYDVVLVDSPPLGIGIDAFALGSATQNIMLILRTGATDRRVAQAKLEVLDRLPVRILGAVLNDVSSDDGAYGYYSYVTGYETVEDEEPVGGTRAGQLTRG